MNKAPASLIGEMSVMDASGHKELKWNTDVPEEVKAAQVTFDRLMEKGYSGFGSRTTDEPKRLVKTFDPTIVELVMVPRTVGG